jgi:tryptophan synthase alpha chain
MGHLVLGYPSLAESERTAMAYLEAGVQLLELQIPFSDPSADGFTITHANHVAIAQGTDTEHCLRAIDRLQAYALLLATQDGITRTVIPMTYLNKLVAYGLERFAREMLAIGISSIIVPDLPLDTPQAHTLIRQGLKPVPVLASNVPPARLAQLLAHQPDYVYIMADFKITGQQFTLDPRVSTLIAAIRHQCRAQVGIGFGISTGPHVQAVLRTADFAIVGSALIRAQEAGNLAEKLTELLEG